MQFQKLRTGLRSYNDDDLWHKLLPVEWKAPYFDTASKSVCLQSWLTCYILQVHSNVYSAVRISFGLIIYNRPIGHDDG